MVVVSLEALESVRICLRLDNDKVCCAYGARLHHSGIFYLRIWISGSFTNKRLLQSAGTHLP